ncbi:Sterile alpha motif domain-containing protein 13 [Trichinella pseudospiralis]|uniref:Sterile alpha motif domain-containing protein 13 n=1 Tax=Trichinella pseudospiralis TaxID=6337 RepID=A0A0V1K6U6_TRIPS|nr:Sterile alpha motif domain-containing protein 13 [Trichinella pseudospiralis]
MSNLNDSNASTEENVNAVVGVGGDSCRRSRGNASAVYAMVRRLTDPINGYYPNGVSPKQVLDSLNILRENDNKLTRKQVQLELSRGVNAGRYVHLGPGVYKTAQIEKSEQATPPTAGKEEASSGVSEEASKAKENVVVSPTIPLVTSQNLEKDEFGLPTLRYDPVLVEAAKTDVKAWSVVQVRQFIEKLGFTKEAAHFEREVIDGCALLLLGKDDYLHNLQLNFGPALKIYRRICTLRAMISGNP